MALGAAPVSPLAPLWRAIAPLDIHRDLPTPHLRAAQVIATAWLVTGQSFLWPEPGLAVFQGAPALAWRLGLALLSTLACLGLLASRRTRRCAAALAALIALEVVVSPTWFAHNRAFAGAVLAMVALSSRRVAWLPRAQVALVFFVAGLDKALAPAWRDGRFVTSFLEQLARFGLMWAPGGQVGGANPLAGWLHARVGDGAAAGLAVIGVEFVIACAFLFALRWGAWVNAAFHGGVFALTGSTMGQFFFAGVATSLLLVKEEDQPRAPLVIGAAALLAGPWTHRYLPVVMLAGLAVWTARRLHHSRSPRN